MNQARQDTPGANGVTMYRSTMTHGDRIPKRPRPIPRAAAGRAWAPSTAEEPIPEVG
jgi:hypothetical protein